MTREITRTHYGIYGNIQDNNKVLVIKKKRGPYIGRFDLPGGSPEKGETEKETLIREIKEETSCDVNEIFNKKEIEVLFSDFIEDDGRDGLLKHKAVIYKCSVNGVADMNISDLDSDGAFWIDVNVLNKGNSTPLVMSVI